MIYMEYHEYTILNWGIYTQSEIFDIGNAAYTC